MTMLNTIYCASMVWRNWKVIFYFSLFNTDQFDSYVNCLLLNSDKINSYIAAKFITKSWIKLPFKKKKKVIMNWFNLCLLKDLHNLLIYSSKSYQELMLPVFIEGSPWSSRTVLNGQNLLRSYCKQNNVCSKSGPLRFIKNIKSWWFQSSNSKQRATRSQEYTV